MSPIDGNGVCGYDSEWNEEFFYFKCSNYNWYFLEFGSILIAQYKLISNYLIILCYSDPSMYDVHYLRGVESF